MSAARAGILLALLVLLAAPLAAAAGQLEVSVPSFPGPQPVGPAILVPVNVTVPCSLLPNGTAQEADLALLDAPAWLVVSDDTTRFHVGPCGADPQVVVVNLRVRLTEDAPALGAAQARLQVRFRNETASTPFVVLAQGFSILDVTSDRAVGEGAPQSPIAFPLHVRNLGNGLTRITIEVGVLPPGWTVLKPQTLTLQARQTGGLVTEGTVNVVVQTPHGFGFHNEVAQVPVWLNASLVGSGNVTDATNLTLTARVKGFDAPGPEAPLVTALVVAAALAWRRRR